MFQTEEDVDRIKGVGSFETSSARPPTSCLLDLCCSPNGRCGRAAARQSFKQFRLLCHSSWASTSEEERLPDEELMAGKGIARPCNNMTAMATTAMAFTHPWHSQSLTSSNNRKNETHYLFPPRQLPANNKAMIVTTSVWWASDPAQLLLQALHSFLCYSTTSSSSPCQTHTKPDTHDQDNHCQPKDCFQKAQNIHEKIIHTVLATSKRAPNINGQFCRFYKQIAKICRNTRLKQAENFDINTWSYKSRTVAILESKNSRAPQTHRSEVKSDDRHGATLESECIFLVERNCVNCVARDRDAVERDRHLLVWFLWFLSRHHLSFWKQGSNGFDRSKVACIRPMTSSHFWKKSRFPFHLEFWTHNRPRLFSFAPPLLLLVVRLLLCKANDDDVLALDANPKLRHPLLHSNFVPFCIPSESSYA